MPDHPTKVLTRSEQNHLLAVVVGTRPGIIKFSPIIRTLQQRQVPFALIHTGQHYSPNMDAIFFEELGLPAPTVQLPAMGETMFHAEQTAEMMKGVEQALFDLQPMAILVGGDANSNLAAALAARKLNVQVCHDEAGLRSHDWLMPEEHNRVMMDHIAEFLFAPNERAAQTLEEERVRGRVVVTGSSLVDAVAQNSGLAKDRKQLLPRLGLSPCQYVVMTAHHEETVDYPETLRNIVSGALDVASRTGMPIVFSAHPRTVKQLARFDLADAIQANGLIRPVDPLGYLDFLGLIANARLVMTDSGGTIQEAAILGVPCVTLGLTTEWQETVDAGANCVAGTEPDGIVRAAESMLSRDRSWQSPFGPEGASERIVDVIENEALRDSGFTPQRPTAFNWS